MENKGKRYYKNGETIWIINQKKEARVKSVNKEEHEVIVTTKDGNEIIEHVLKLWEIDKLKFLPKEKLLNKKRANKSKKVTYFSSVEGGIIPTRDEENGGRDCFARIVPEIRDGKEIFEMYLPKMKVSKIPLGFASYLEKDDVLSLKHERSSIGELGVIATSGLIDSTYQGEISYQIVPLIANILISSEVEEVTYHDITNTYLVPFKKAIAQAVIFKLSDAEDTHIPYDRLLKMPSKRGTNGWGSTDK